MNYSKIQKFLSGIIIFSLLFGVTFRFPLMNFKAFAGDREYYDLVSVLVEEEIYSDIEDRIKRYAEDLQGYLENTKVVILPTPKKTPAFNIASLIELLYFEGYKGITSADYESKLVGTVLVGDLNLPEVYLGNNSLKTIVPYTDFEDKQYVYNHENGKYEENSDNIDGLKSEIWHGIISPNLGESFENTKAIKDYFDKNHDFYQGTGNFESSEFVINGKKSDGVLEDYSPAVFYYDSFRENSSLNYNNYVGYQSYIDNREDIVYNRFNKELAEKISDAVMGDQTDTFEELIYNVDPDFDVSQYSDSMNISNTPDVQTRTIIENVTKHFIEMFSKGTIGDFREDVHNAGRYNLDKNRINMDLVPHIITALDIVNDSMLKDGSYDLEEKIDDIVINKLQEDIYVPYRATEGSLVSTGLDINGDDIFATITDTHENILYGKQVINISNAEECSIFRGSTYNSGTLVEANRGYNYDLVEDDITKLGAESTSCLAGIQNGTSLVGYWGYNTSLNADFSDFPPFLKSSDLIAAIEPIFDIAGTGKVTDTSLTYPNAPILKDGASYYDCLENNFFVSIDEEMTEQGIEIVYQIPINGQSRVNWTCSSTSQKSNFTIDSYEVLQTQTTQIESSPGVYTTVPKCTGLKCRENNLEFYFKAIPSYVMHKSPTYEELDVQIKNMISSSLPVDKDRYIDFKGATGYQKINYPYLFRLYPENGLDLTLENFETALDNYLDTYDSILGESLVDYLKSKPSISGLDSSKANYYDTLVFSIFWSNLDVSSKYKFVFENYLSDQFGGNNFNFNLAKNKGQYEIAYLGAKGDSSNMYIMLDPEAKGTNPFADIVSNNTYLSNSLLGYNITNQSVDTETTFNCAPPEGVIIWEWLPTVACWISDMLPPTISFSSSECVSNSGLSPEDAEDLLLNGGDTNKNGVVDCIESNLTGGSIDLSSSSSKYNVNKLGKLKATLKDEDGNIITLDSSTKINFVITKISVPENEKLDFTEFNTKDVYIKEIFDASEFDNKEYLKYVDFVEGDIRASYGVGEKTFYTKNKIANITFKSFIEILDYNGNIILQQESNPITIQVRSDSLFANTYKLSNSGNNPILDYGEDSLIVSGVDNIIITSDSNINNMKNNLGLLDAISQAKEKLFLGISNFDKSGNIIGIKYPLYVKIVNENNEVVLDEKQINNIDTTVVSLGAYSVSGIYNILIKDDSGYEFKKEIIITPEIPSKLEVVTGSSVLETGGAVTTNLFTIYDEFDNIVYGDFYDIDLNIDGDGILFQENNKDNIKFSTLEGYKTFNIISTSNADINNLNFSIKNNAGVELFNDSVEIQTIEKINFVIQSLQSEINIGGEKYAYEVTYRDAIGKILTDFNSRVYLNVPEIYGKSTSDYFEVKNGKATVEFVTTNVAGENVQIEFQTEGLKNIGTKIISILPDDPIQVELYISNPQMEATTSNYTTIRAELKDKYGNLVFTDNTTGANLEIPKEYEKVLNKSSTSTYFSNGIATFEVYATDIPGIGYFSVGTSPSLANNSFTVSDESGSITINGVGENTGKLETYFFWNKNNIDGKKYNSIYTTLLGSNYGDITQTNYLAGSLLFDGDNKALGVTSLLNNPESTNDVVNILKGGNIKNIYKSSDLSQDIKTSVGFKDDNIILDIYNNSLNTFVGNIYYNFNSDTLIKICDTNIDDCDISEDETSIFIKLFSSDYSAELSSEKITIKDDQNTNILDIDNLGNINKYSNISFEIDEGNTSDYLLLNIINNGELIGNIGYNFVNPLIKSTNQEDVFNNNISYVGNSILLLLKSSSYGAKDSLDNKIIYYNDPFDSTSNLDVFSSSNNYAYEKFADKSSIGWKDGNKSLLAFASGKSIGESVKDYMSFSVINLGDPVISLKKIQEKLPKTDTLRNFDSTIGKLISTDSDIESYEVFDYDNDDKDDFLLIKYDGRLKLLENKSVASDFIDKGNLANIVDLGNKSLIKTGDFTGDSYDDIFFVNNKGKPFLLNNVIKDFTRISLEDQFSLSGSIIKSESFDMNNDTIDDIVTLDDAGAINIFYGGGTDGDPQFTKNLVTDNYGIKIPTDTVNNNALVYFDGLYQLPKEGDNTSFDKDDNIPYDLTDNLIFENLFYKSSTQDYDLNYLENLEVLSEEDLVDGIDYTTDDYVTFLKSEYSENLGLKVEKQFIDKNGGFLQAGDTIGVNITLTNLTSSTFTDVVYGEKINDLFTLLEDSIQIDDENINLLYNVTSVDFLIEDLQLNPLQTLEFSYLLETKPFDYGHLIVGLYETDEVGDDYFGDIILKEDNQNCSEPVEIYRSISDTTYQKGLKEPICNEANIILPDILEQNKIDADGNGIPDYIDELGDTTDITALQDYADDNIGSAQDSSKYDDDKEIDEKIYDALEEAEYIIDGLGCGFGEGCIATPLNWAPLAPGGDPTLFGKPIGDGLKIDEGIPVFSALTGLQTTCGNSPCCLPAVWPVTPLTYTPGPTCGGLGAGGMLGTNSSTNFFRLFITPTLTGSMGTAMCFGAPASVAGKPPFKGISPIVPGGNCIVTATPLSYCDDDGSDGDIASTGFNGLNGEDFSLINGNCDTDTRKPNFLFDDSLFSDYYDYKKTGNASPSLESDLNDYYNAENNPSSDASFNEPEQPFFTLDGGSGEEIDVGIDFSSIESGNFEDIIKIEKTRIGAFPNFLMDWATRQIEEIVNKLTDFPTIFIILPDFTGIFDGNWSELSGNTSENLSDNIEISDDIEKVLPDGTIDKIQKTESGIREAYEFLSTVPLVKIEKETVNLNIPWIDAESLDKTLKSREETVQQRKDELKRVKEAWSFGAGCSYTDPDEQAKCEETNNIKNNISLDVEAFISSIERNIDTIEDYKKTPEKIYKWLNKKEVYLEQILCNIDALSSIMGGRISDNGKRFKAWVEAYILIKAMLKSWQMLIDVFIDFDAECHECKNERSDLQTSIWSLIDMIIPSIPVIQFPKWPDIIIDLHNIRAGLTIALPEFSLANRPIVLPYLPSLTLQDTPTININLPELPLLPTIEIPELPDIPSLPSVELPNLPPPPILPKILSPIEVMVDILKLVTKMMCILKSSPFVPEWRAGDQIAFITERQGFMSFDFFDATLPQFSFPFVDAIEITTYLNLEFETDFIVELARQTAKPINSFANDITPLFDIYIDDIDITKQVPSSIDIDIGGDGEIEGEIGFDNTKNIELLFVEQVSKNINKLVTYVDENKDVGVSNLEFKKLVNNSLASSRITKDPRLDKIRELWEDVNNMTYSKENKVIEDLKKSNKEKFDLVKNIINTEIVKNKSLQEKYENINNNQITKVSFVDSSIDLDFYNKQLSLYNNKTITAYNFLINNEGNSYKKELELEGEKLLGKLDTGFKKYMEDKKQDINLLADLSDDFQTVTGENSCQAQAKSEYKYVYEGIYIVEDSVSYRLFDYIDDLSGDEETTIIDYDNDLDEDLIYMYNSEIYVKENLKNKPIKSYVSSPPIVLKSSDNKFYNGSIFYEGINNFEEVGIDNEYINLSFSNLNRENNMNYRIEFYNIIDKFLNVGNSNYVPEITKKSIVDAFAGINDEIIDLVPNTNYETRNNLGYISATGNLKNIELTTLELINIKNDLENGNIVSLSMGTKIYSGDSSFLLIYKEDGSDEEKIISASSHTNIELKQGINVIQITGDAYIEGSQDITLNGTNIKQYSQLPLFPGTRIKVLDDSISYTQGEYPYIDISYYDGTTLSIDFEKVNDYEIYDLGYIADDYIVRVKRNNDYYYAQIKSFLDDIIGSHSNQILLSPQAESDTNPPELYLSSKIKIPVYQKKKIDFTNYIYENSGIKNISDIFIDFDLETDSDLDGNTVNDNDTDKINITKNSSKVEIEFGEYDSLFSKNIGITMIDANGNTGYAEVEFEVYSPIPDIKTYDNGKISGDLSEDLTKEPVNFYRYRSGVIKKLEDINGIDVVLTNTGNYEFEVDETGEGLNILQSNTKIALIDEKSGIIELKDPASTIDVLPTSDINNDVVYPKIVINKNGAEIYSEYIKITGEQNVNIVDDFSGITDEGVYTKFLDKSTYGYFEIPEGAKYSPGTLSIYRQSNVNKESLFTIFPDGRINTINDYYSLKYFDNGSNVGFILFDKYYNNEVAQVLLFIDGYYILK